MNRHLPARRSFIAAAAAITISALTAACGSSRPAGSNDADQANVAPGQTVTLNYWTWFPAETTLKKSIAAFEAANPTIKITLREFAAADYQKQLPLALNGGQGLDIAGVQISAMTNTVRSQLRPVSDWQKYLPADWRSQLDANMLQQTQAIAKDDTLYSVPMGSIGSAVVYANADELKKHGIAFPKTLDELASATAKVKAAGSDVTPVVFTGDSWFQNEMFLTVADQIDPKLSDSLYAGKTAWNSQQMVQALTAYQNLYKNGVLDTATLSLKGSAADDLFNSGKAAFLVQGSWNNSVLSAPYRSANKIAAGDVTAGAFPVVMPGGQAAVRTYAEGGLAIPRSSKYVAQAAKFIEFMTLGGGVPTWAQDLVLVPSKAGFKLDQSILTTPAAQQGYTAVQQVMAKPGSGRGAVTTTFTSTVLDNGLLDLARGSITPQALADKLQQEWASGRYPVS